MEPQLKKLQYCVISLMATLKDLHILNLEIKTVHPL
ncbi:unnamed protein product [Leptidea sinapis]|uniref:Uncharacterized protein n=1 Tax=Leptidea sinapis TaxID=189913 RepID=A0A5E4Q6V2_9NEOP|nr:unnamed protein product [Leptidea sinapis]